MPNKPKKAHVGPKQDVQDVVKALIFIYTQNRLLTKRIAAKASVTGPQLSVIKMLEKLGDLSLTELSESIRAQNSTMTGIVDRMEREGLVDRVRSKDDRRVIHIHLTPKGMKIAEEVPVEPLSILREAIELLDAKEIHDLAASMRKLSDGVRAIVARDVPEAS